MATDMAVKVPLIWGTDAIHRHGNAHGATLFPHNKGLGTAHNPELVGAIGGVVGRQVRSTGVNWVFGPTLAVECEAPCLGEADLSPLLKKIPLNKRHTVKIALSCLEDQGADFLNVKVPFSVSATEPFAAAFTQIQIVPDEAKDADTLTCSDLGVNNK